MSGPALVPRRGFLRGLASLPLIGGGVALIGKPTAAAVPVTDALHERYLTWLAHEHREAVREHAFRGDLAHARRDPGDFLPHELRPDYLFWFPDAPDIEETVKAAPPSTRAAVVLAAVGCGWRERGNEG